MNSHFRVYSQRENYSTKIKENQIFSYLLIRQKCVLVYQICLNTSNIFEIILKFSEENLEYTIDVYIYTHLDFQGGSVVKNLPDSAGGSGDLGSIPGLGRSPGVGKGNPLLYSCLKNPIDIRAWWATVHGVTKGLPRLSDWAPSIYTFGYKSDSLLQISILPFSFIPVSLIFPPNKVLTVVTWTLLWASRPMIPSITPGISAGRVC